MGAMLSEDQRKELEQELRQQLEDLDRRQALHQGGVSRVEHARDVLTQDQEDAIQRGTDREVELALNDREMVEVGEIAQALQRLARGEYGLCEDCGTGIPFARLRLTPTALRCVACESAREQAAGGVRRATL